MLAKGPDGHLRRATRHKDKYGRALRHDAKRSPGADLISVIWARDKVEHKRERVAIWERDFTDLKLIIIFVKLFSTKSTFWTGRAQIHLQQVNRKIAKLAHDKGNQRIVDLGWWHRWRVQRVINIVAHVSGESPETQI